MSAEEADFTDDAPTAEEDGTRAGSPTNDAIYRGAPEDERMDVDADEANTDEESDEERDDYEPFQIQLPPVAAAPRRAMAAVAAEAEESDEEVDDDGAANGVDVLGQLAAIIRLREQVRRGERQGPEEMTADDLQDYLDALARQLPQPMLDRLLDRRILTQPAKWTPEPAVCADTGAYQDGRLVIDQRGRVSAVDVDFQGYIVVLSGSYRFLASCVSIYLPNGELKSSFTIDGFAGGLACAPDGRIVVANYTREVVQVLGRADGSILASFPRDSCTGVAVNDEGLLALCGEGKSYVKLCTLEGEEIRRFGTPGKELGEFQNPCGLAFARRDRLVVVDYRNNRIQVVDLHGHVVASFGTQGTAPGQFNLPRDVTVSRDGEIIVADTGNDRIQMFSSTGAFLCVCGSSGQDRGQIKQPSDVSITFDGRVVVADTMNDRVQIWITPATRWQPERHYQFPGSFKQTVRTLLLLRVYGENRLNEDPDALANRVPPWALLCELPIEVLFLMMSITWTHFHHASFDEQPPAIAAGAAAADEDQEETGMDDGASDGHGGEGEFADAVERTRDTWGSESAEEDIEITHEQWRAVDAAGNLVNSQ